MNKKNALKDFLLLGMKWFAKELVQSLVFLQQNI